MTNAFCLPDALLHRDCWTRHLGLTALDRFKYGQTAPFLDARGNPMPGSIASLERVTLGGVPQSVVIRSQNVANPILLYLHGGPGTSELGMLRTYNLPSLEQRFTVAVWDQRGAAKSYSARHPVSGMTVEQLVADTGELVELLCRRFGHQKIYLVGHSWGSALGILAVKQQPDRFHAYVGVGQMVNMLEGERLSYAWTLEHARKAGDRRSVARLERIGVPPYAPPMRPKVIAQRAILARYGGEVHGNRHGGIMTVLRCLFRTREYGWIDRINYFRGIFVSMDLLWPQIMSINLFEQAPKLDVPVYFLAGAYDQEAPSILAERYYRALMAPRKRLIWFRNSAHFVNTEEPDAFNRFFVGELLADDGQNG